MNEPDVAVTDFLLAGESLFFACALARRPPGAFKVPLLLVFAGSGLAAAAGGVFHGFLASGSAERAVLSWASLVLVGLTACGFALVGAELVLDDAWAPAVRKSLATLFAAYLLGSLIERRFILAILFYVPATVLALWGFLQAHRRLRERRLLAGIGGLVLSLAAPVVQQAGLSLPGLGLTHNAVYHLILMVALALFFAGAGGLPDAAERA